MASRLCSCCGQSYTDDERHDYEKCVKDCEVRVNHAMASLRDARECLEMAIERRRSQREGRIK